MDTCLRRCRRACDVCSGEPASSFDFAQDEALSLKMRCKNIRSPGLDPGPRAIKPSREVPGQARDYGGGWSAKLELSSRPERSGEPGPSPCHHAIWVPDKRSRAFRDDKLSSALPTKVGIHGGWLMNLSTAMDPDLRQESGIETSLRVHREHAPTHAVPCMVNPNPEFMTKTSHS